MRYSPSYSYNKRRHNTNNEFNRPLLENLNEPSNDSVPESILLEPNSNSINRDKLEECPELTKLLSSSDKNELERFLNEVHFYFKEKGLQCFVLSFLLNMFVILFVCVFSLFVTNCVDYSKIVPHNSLKNTIYKGCLNRFGLMSYLFILFTFFCVIVTTIQFVIRLPKVVKMCAFYENDLKIPNEDIQSVEWDMITNKLIKLSKLNTPSNNSLDELFITNVLMRSDNYFIALVSEFEQLFNSFWFTSTMEFNIRYCIESVLFTKNGRINPLLLTTNNNNVPNSSDLTKKMIKRFRIMAAINIIFCPFILLYTILILVLKNFEEYYSNLSTLSNREYTLFSRWHFREFNELDHYFQQRLNDSKQIANRYISLAPKTKTVMTARFVAFVVGSIAAVFIILSLYHTELLVDFEVTKNKSLLFYIGAITSLLSVLRQMVSVNVNKNETPQLLLGELLEELHYLPDNWRENLHSTNVRQKFCSLYRPKIIQVVNDLVSIIYIPIVLMFVMPKKVGKIVRFYKKNSTRIKGLGFVCNLAQFELETQSNNTTANEIGLENSMKISSVYNDKLDTSNNKSISPNISSNIHFMSKNGKLEKSMVNFKNKHPKWMPSNINNSIYLNKIQHTMNQLNTTDNSMQYSILMHNLKHQNESNTSPFKKGVIGLIEHVFNNQ